MHSKEAPRPTTKAELHASFQRLLRSSSSPHSDAPYQSVYWSPSGGTTGRSLHIPVDIHENDLQRAALVPLLTASGVYTTRTINANLFDGGGGGADGNMYRSLEIFHDFVGRCGGTSLPLGWSCSDENTVRMCAKFRANALSGSPSRLCQLSGHVLWEARRLERRRRRSAAGGGSSSEDDDDDDAGAKKLEELCRWRDGVRTVVFACEPMFDSRERLIRAAFPSAEIASVLGGAEVGCWGVSLPGMKHNTFLFDRRVVEVRAARLNRLGDGTDDTLGEEELSMVTGKEEELRASVGDKREGSIVGDLVVTCHLRQRFPVRNFATGDVGSVVPASEICPRDALATAEAAVREATWPKGGKVADGPFAAAEAQAEPLLQGVIFSARGCAALSNQFHAYEHNLDASEFLAKASSFALEGMNTGRSENAALFVNGQVVVRFDERLRERIDVHVIMTTSSELDEDQQQAEVRVAPAALSAAATGALRGWIMETLDEEDLAAATTVTVEEAGQHSALQTSATASNRNKIPLLRDLRGDVTAGDGVTTGPSEARETKSGIPDEGIPPPPVSEDKPLPGARPASVPSPEPSAVPAARASGLDPRSVWVGAYQACPAPVWSVPRASAAATRDGLARALRRRAPPGLLRRVPPDDAWAPYPFAVTLPLYDGIVGLCAELRGAVGALLSPRGLEVLREFYDGVGGGLRVPDEVAPLVFGSVEKLPPPKPGSRVKIASDESGASRMSSIDAGWSNTLIRGRSDASDRSRLTSIESAPLEELEEPEEEDSLPLSNLGVTDRIAQDVPLSFLVEGLPELEDTGVAARSTGATASMLQHDVVFWRPDILFDSAKAKRCKSCFSPARAQDREGSLPISGDDNATQPPFWPPTEAKLRQRRRKCRSSAVPPVSICEINARFTLNGFSMSAFGTDAASCMLGFPPGCPVGTSKVGDDDGPGTWRDLNLAPAHRLVVMKDEIRKRVSSPCPTWFVKGREVGYDCHSMEEMLEAPVREVTPAELPALLDEWFSGSRPLSSLETEQARSRTRKRCRCDPSQTLDIVECEAECSDHRGGSHCELLIFLELHQDELLSLPPSTLAYLTGSVTAVRSCCCRSPMRVVACNPLPVIFLLHDKRTLAVLSDKDVLERLVGPKTASVVADAVVKTVPLSDSVRAATCNAYPCVLSVVEESFAGGVGKGDDFGTRSSSQPLSMPPKWMLEMLSKAVSHPSDFVLKRC